MSEITAADYEYFVQTTLASCIIGCLTLVLISIFVFHKCPTPALRSAIYYVAFIGVTVFVYLSIEARLKHSFLYTFYCFLFYYSDSRRQLLLVYWSVCIVATVFVFCFASHYDGTINSDTQKSHFDRSLMNGNWHQENKYYSTSDSHLHVRKFFHILLSLVASSGFLYDWQLTLLASTAIVFAFICIECARVLQVIPIGAWIDDNIRPFIDEQDSGIIVTTHILLMLGVFLPFWIHFEYIKTTSTKLSFFAGVISTGVGDSFAALIGRVYGRHKVMRNHPKSYEGALACFTTQLLAIYILQVPLKYYFTSIEWFTLIMICFLVAALEAILRRFDNLLLPIVSFALIYMFID